MKTLLALLLMFPGYLIAGKSVTVYDNENSQAFYPVQKGDTLGTICREIKTGYNLTTSQCLKQLFHDNPQAFSNNNINQLISGKKLWLPGSYHPVSRVDNSKYTTERFSWGSIKTPK